MKHWWILLCTIVLSSCASAPPPKPQAQGLLNDSLFQAPNERISADSVFALSDEMKRFLRVEIGPQLLVYGRQRGLINALYNKNQLKLEFDNVMTRNAAQAFDARSGNCLSLVIMTAAFAKELGLNVRYQQVLVDETWTHAGDYYLSIGHVNLSLTDRRPELGHVNPDNMTIDFLTPRDVNGYRVVEISEQTILAMYMNNRGAEALTAGRVDDAYWWVRGAIAKDPEFLSAYNTLGAIYQRHDNAVEAERAFKYALEREPTNTHVMSNLVPVLKELGRVGEAKALAARLDDIDPNPPFSYFKRGQAALKEGNYKAAKEWFAREVDRAPYYHEFQFWLAVACAYLGQTEEARKHLTIAMQNSTTRSEHDIYAAKLARLGSANVH